MADRPLMKYNSTPPRPKAAPQKNIRDAAIALYNLLDDIDTFDDMAKGNEAMYRNLVRKAVDKRHDIAASDGNSLEFNLSN